MWKPLEPGRGWLFSGCSDVEKKSKTEWDYKVSEK